MGSDYFQFKQFSISQGRTAMKVCTESCLFGAWTASLVNVGVKHVLDIGTGTGLLSLMLAQKSRAAIHALEIDKGAYEDAANNFAQSKWNERLQAEHVALQKFRPSNTFDVIISNPPFYKNDLRPADASRTAALHDEQLTAEELLDAAAKLIGNDGRLGLLIASRRAAEIEQAGSDSGFIVERKAMVKQSPAHEAFRVMYWFAKSSAVTREEEEIIIRGTDGSYTDQFVAYLRDYYLYL